MENLHMSIKSHYPLLSKNETEEEFDYDMIYARSFVDGKLWVIWKEVKTGDIFSSNIELAPERPAIIVVKYKLLGRYAIAIIYDKNDDRYFIRQRYLYGRTIDYYTPNILKALDLFNELKLLALLIK